MKSKRNKEINDDTAYVDLWTGNLTDFEWSCVFDDNSIYNIPKQNRENLEMNAELNEYFKKKEEKEKALIISLIEQLYAYISWKQTIDAEAYTAAAKINENMGDNYRKDEDRLIKDSSAEKGWIENLIKTLFPQDEQHYYRSSLAAPLEQHMKTASKDEKETIRNVLQLATRNKNVRTFIFEKAETTETDDKTKHFELILQRIFIVGNALKNEIPSGLQEHLHAIKKAENKQEAESDKLSTRRGPH